MQAWHRAFERWCGRVLRGVIKVAPASVPGRCEDCRVGAGEVDPCFLSSPTPNPTNLFSAKLRPQIREAAPRRLPSRFEAPGPRPTRVSRWGSELWHAPACAIMIVDCGKRLASRRI